MHENVDGTRKKCALCRKELTRLQTKYCSRKCYLKSHGRFSRKQLLEVESVGLVNRINAVLLRDGLRPVLCRKK